jgi:molybdate transport system regulatory protein
MSYRRAWLLLEDMNLIFDRPVARTSVGGRGGGGAMLTTFGEHLLSRASATYVEARSGIEPLYAALQAAA